MEIAFQVVSIILIIGAVLLFWKKNSGNPVITNFQKALVVFQILEYYRTFYMIIF